MTDINLGRRLRRVANGALLLSAVALLAACSSDKKESLLLVNAPLGVYAGSAATMDVHVTVGSGEVAQHSLDARTNASGTYGFYLSASVSGSATVTVLVYDAGGCLLATGIGGPVEVSAGKTSGPIAVIFQASDTPCVPDASTSAPEPSVDGGAPDSLGAEVLGSTEAGPSLIDGPPGVLDVARADTQISDARPDVAADVPLNPEVAADVPSTDLPQGPEVGVDGSATGIDTPSDVAPTPLNVFRKCAEYTHTVTFSSGTVGDWGVLRLVFTPDGKNLISYGEDGRVKVWDVTPAGLVPQSSALVFLGDGELTGTISADGKYLAVGERDGKTMVYDFPGSIDSGAGLSQWELPATGLTPTPWRAFPRHFTSDGNHLVVLYGADSSPDPNVFTVWDLTTQKIVRSVSYAYDDWPMAAHPGSYSDSMWVASAAKTTLDGGVGGNMITLMDVAQSGPLKTQAIVRGEVGAMAFSPDGNSLAVGLGNSEVGLWDVTDKSKLVAPAAPLLGATSGIYTGVYAFSFTSDGAFLAAATEGSGGSVVKLVSVAGKQVVQKELTYTPSAVAFAPNNLALAIGERNKGVLLYCTP